VDAGKPGGAGPIEAAEARAYALQVANVVNQVHGYYVRPVPRHRLYHAALCGLYEAASLPVPPGLEAELQKKIVEPKAADAEAAMQRPGDDEVVIGLLVKARSEVGDVPGLGGLAATKASLQALTRVLDPHSMLVEGREFRRSSGEGLNHGLGIDLAADEVEGPVRIKALAIGGPAQRAGLRPGDRITHVDGRAVARANWPQMQSRLTEDDNPEAAEIQKIELTVVPAGSDQPRRLLLEKRPFRAETVFGVQRAPDESWSYLLDRKYKLGYLRIGALEHGTGEDVHAALTALRSEGMRGLILDLRWSPGGFLKEAEMVSRVFLKEGSVIATIKSRQRDDDQVYRADFASPFTHFPLIVLINGETMGGAELIAAALLDNNRASFAGQRSFGKASIQTMLPLQGDTLGFKLTTGQFVRPSGKALHRFPDSKPSDDWGVRPSRDLEMRLTPDLSGQLRDWHLLQALRPHRINEVLPLDDPEKDPQRQLALEALRKVLREKD
jgi:carboxyl-terminal processing protease